MSKTQTTHTIVVDVPVQTAYGQWTQFEQFPAFMGGVQSVRQQGPDQVEWVVEIAGRKLAYVAKIVEQTPDRKIAWRSVSGKKTGGMVTFRPLTEASTEVTLDLMYEPEGALESVADLLGLVAARTRADLQNFKRYIEGRGVETGAWRGEIHGGLVEDRPSQF
ncbi:MAG: SRPBCC family protein [Myxococcota bacterium]